MDDRRFDDLARFAAGGGRSRRALVKLLAGGAFLALLVRLGGGANVAQAAPCRQRNRPCARDAQCCAGGRCQGGKCRCRPEGTPCASFASCCSQSCDFLVGGGTCSPCRGQPCSADRDCCGGHPCRLGYCDGCRNRAVVCSGASDCCFSDCGNYGGTNVCLSDFGGRCARDVDCGGCYLSGYCAGACVDGSCTV